MHLFCFGYGYVAQFFAKKLINLGWKISGTSSNKYINGANIFHYNEVSLDVFTDVTHVLISIPPDGDDVLKRYGKYLNNINWLGYLSATSVYGDHFGNWVDETSETKCTSKRGEDRFKSEQKWLGSNLPAHIFRLAGIYGPGRNMLIDLKLGKARNVNHFFSRIHVEDISNILLSSMNNIKPREIYNCADDLPATQSEVVTYAAKLLNIFPPEPTDILTIPTYARSFYLESKKVSNKKIKQDLNISLIYPNYRIGLKSLIKQL